MNTKSVTEVNYWVCDDVDVFSSSTVCTAIWRVKAVLTACGKYGRVSYSRTRPRGNSQLAQTGLGLSHSICLFLH